MNGTKTIGEPWTGGPAGFEFTVEQVGDANGGAMTADTVKAALPSPATATSDANGNFTFGNITFSKPGTYYFKVTEVDTKIPGVNYVADGKIVTVNVVEADGGNGNGVLNATVADGSPELAFTNTYTQKASVPYVPTISKTVSGHAAAAEQFSFQLIAADDATKQAIANKEITGPNGAELTVDQNTGVVETVANKDAIDNGGTEDGITFSSLVFNKVVENPGYNFIVKEVVEADDNGNDQDGVQNAGWTMDTHEYKINITVKDDASQLTVVPTYNDAEGNATSPVFSNTFGAATTLDENGGLNVTKELQNRTLEEKQFEFTIGVAAGIENYNDALAKLQQAGGDKFDATAGTLNFSNGTPDAAGKAVMQPLNSLAFDQNDINKTFTYMVSENTANYSPEVNGYTPDTATFKVEIAVLEGENGKIYTSTKVTEINDGVAGEPVVSDGSNGEVAVAPFVNSYAADGSVTVEATKTLNNRDMVAEEFEFGVVPQGSVQDGSADVATAKNGADGKISFTINYTIEELNKLVADGASYVTKNPDGTWTLSYTAYEKASLPEGVTADKAFFDFTVNVTDNGDGTLTATPAFANSDTNTFVNTYGKDAKASANIEATKTLHGRDQQNGEFKFSVKQGKADGNGVEVLTGVSTAGKMDAATKVVFTDKGEGATAAEQGVLGEYTFESLKAAVDAGWATGPEDVDGKRQWTLDYSISELTDAANMPAGVQVTTGHPDRYNFTVTVVDNGDGTLTAATHYPKDKTAFDFDNSYAPTMQTALTIPGEKFLKGPDPKIDITNAFTFTLTGVANANKAEGFVESAKNPAATGGKVALGGLVYTIDDIKDEPYKDGYIRTKTFTYTVTEKGELAGVTNDAAAGAGEGKGKTVTVTLTDNGKTGELTATVAMDENNNAFTFTNTYEPGAVTNTPANVTKVLEGRTPGLQADEFEFEMSVEPKANTDTPADGFTMPADATAKNKADGTVTFGNITFKKAGTYTVTVKEKVPTNKAPFMTYDEHEYVYDVEVTVDGTGTLHAEAKNVSGSPEFKNVYKADEDSKTVGTAKDPQTSINGQLVGVGDELTYTINWVNDALNEKGESVEAEVAVTDAVPAGTEFVSATEGGVESNGTVTWNLGTKDPGAKGSVTMTVRVTDAAVNADEIANTAEIALGDNDPKTTNKVTNTVPEKKVTEAPEGDLQVGDELAYSIEWANTTGAEAEVSVSDELSDGLTFVKASDGGAANGQTVTWNLGKKAAGESGTVTVTVRVNESALTVDELANKATITVGDKSSSTNKVVTDKPKTGKLTISKTVALYDESTAAPDQEFTFTVELQDKNGEALAGTYNFAGTSDGNTEYTGTVTNGGTVTLKANGSVTITGLPDGASYRVTEAGVEGAAYQVSYENTWFDVLAEGEDGAKGAEVNDATNVGFIAAEKTAKVAVTNTYAPEHVVLPGADNLKVQKVLEGRDWLANEKYTFEISAVTEGAPLPENTTLELGKPAKGNTQTASFGDIRFAKAGTYEYKIVETGASADKNLTFSQAEYKVVVTVTPENGALKVSSVMTQVKNDKGEVTGAEAADNTAVFTNTYTKPDQKKDVTKAEDPTASINGKLVGVGDELTYTINWVNDAVNDKGEAAEAEVTITDEIPAGTELVEDSIVGYGASVTDKTITWNLGKQAANASGTVSFTVKVTDAAVSVNKIENKADLTIGGRKTTTNTVTNDFPKKTVGDNKPTVEGDIQVGDTLTYTIEWANTTGDTADVKITDVLSDGLTFVEADNGGMLGDDGKTVTWNLASQSNGASGAVTVKVRVNENAVKVNTNNKATVQVGNGSSVTTNTVPGPELKTGNLKVSKTVVDGDENKLFDFTVEVRDKAGNKLNGVYGDLTFTDGVATFQLKHGESKEITGLPEGAAYRVTETAADGYRTTVDGNNEAGTIAADKTIEVKFTNTYGSVVPIDKPVTLDGLFTKKFTGRTWNAADEFTFKIVGVDKDGNPVEQPMPEKTEVKVAGDGKSDTQAINFGTIGFTFDDIKDVAPDKDGKRAKTFYYDVYEVQPADGAMDIPGVTYDKHHAKLVITLTDNGKGELAGSADIAATTRVVNDTFHNVYKSELNYTRLSGFDIAKTLHGRDIAKDYFTFVVDPADKASADKLGLPEGGKEYKSLGGEEGQQTEIASVPGDNVTFSQEDAGKTYTYTVYEKDEAATHAGYTYDANRYTVTITTADDPATAKLTVTTVVTNEATSEEVSRVAVSADATESQRAVVPFENNYDENAPAEVSLNATKTLTGRDSVAGEFKFQVTDAKGNVVANGSNAAAPDGQAGAVTFDKLSYTIDKLVADARAGIAEFDNTSHPTNYVYTYHYTVSEVTDGLDAGVTPVNSAFKVTVKVTDDGEGGLSTQVIYPEGSNDTLTFTNTYGVGAAAELPVKGEKNLAVASGNNAPDITGKYTFKLTGSEGAPMPEKTEATNDAAGNVDFGSITYTMENVFGPEAVVEDKVAADGQTEGESAEAATTAEEDVEAASAPRTKTFTYTVTEAGRVAGVANDAEASKTFTVTVTDNGDGTISVDPSNAGLTFSFTNTYSVQPVTASVTDQVSISKTISGTDDYADGREMAAGEFKFEMVDAAGNVVATGANDAAGTSSKVTFTPITFNEPGEHDYVLREVKGAQGGIGFDEAEHAVHASVVDNGDGTLSVTFTQKAAGSDASEGITFHNTYEAQPTTLSLSAGKVLIGRDLKDGEFAFELAYTAGDKEHVLKASNDADGNVTFDKMKFTKAGEYTFKIREVAGDDPTITYDSTVYEATVVVEDDGNGQLVVKSVAYGDGAEAPVFRNTYEKPETPENPEEPKGPELPQTGDSGPSPMVLGAVAAAGVGLIGCGAALAKRGRRNGQK